ncbi:hypothetical protein ES702_02644 [subsurface metagenome]
MTFEDARGDEINSCDQGPGCLADTLSAGVVVCAVSSRKHRSSITLRSGMDHDSASSIAGLEVISHAQASVVGAMIRAES